MPLESIDPGTSAAIGGTIAAGILGFAKVIERYMGTKRYDGDARTNLEEQKKIAQETRETLHELKEHMEDQDDFFDRLLRHIDDQARATMEVSALLKAYLARGGRGHD